MSHLYAQAASLGYTARRGYELIPSRTKAGVALLVYTTRIRAGKRKNQRVLLRVIA